MLPVWAQVHAELALLIRGAWVLLLLCCGGLGSCRLVAAVAMCRVTTNTYCSMPAIG